MANRTLVLITGANSGIGFELAAQLLSKARYHVLLCARSPSKGTAALQSLQSRNLPGTAEMLHVDVTDDETITRAAAEVESRHGRLDILVNNAAVGYVKGTLREQMRLSFDTNATSALILGSAFAPLLQKSNDARIINISSGMGSITRRLDALSPMYKVQATTYRVSKAALNMITACQVAEYGDQGVRVFAYDPGFTVSNLSENNKEEKGARKVEDSVRPLVDVLEGRRDGEMGKLLHNEGSYEW